jgi:hypothetical protein
VSPKFFGRALAVPAPRGGAVPSAGNITQGQLAFEHEHLKEKLRHRDPERFRVICRTRQITAHPLFVVVAGEIELWEKGR